MSPDAAEALGIRYGGTETEAPQEQELPAEVAVPDTPAVQPSAGDRVWAIFCAAMAENWRELGALRRGGVKALLGTWQPPTAQEQATHVAGHTWAERWVSAHVTAAGVALIALGREPRRLLIPAAATVAALVALAAAGAFIFHAH